MVYELRFLVIYKLFIVLGLECDRRKGGAKHFAMENIWTSAALSARAVSRYGLGVRDACVLWNDGVPLLEAKAGAVDFRFCIFIECVREEIMDCGSMVILIWVVCGLCIYCVRI